MADSLREELASEGFNLVEMTWEEYARCQKGFSLQMLKSCRGLEKQVAELAEALSWFLDDDRFHVAVGGNPNVVEKMIDEARDRMIAAAKGGEDE
ncbi:MAG: hypothetical protein AAFY24_01945 [Pseudomonadota bacterium]